MIDFPAPSFAIPPMVAAPGTKLVSVGVYVFQCPRCRKIFRYDDCVEPACTGPSETRDEHPMEVMHFIRKETRQVMV